MTTETDFPLLQDPEDLEDTGASWLKIPFIGLFLSYQRQIRNETKLTSQAVNRGSVPDSAWSAYSYSADIRKKLEEIVIENAYPKGSAFHPLDPFELMMVLRYGDLNEVEIAMDIEDEYGIKFDDALCLWLIDEHVTFVDFIKYIEGQLE